MTDRPVPSTDNRAQALEQLTKAHPDIAAPEAELGVLLWSASAGLVRTFEAHLQRYGLSPARFAVLMTLLSSADHRRTPSDLADRISVRRPTLTGIVDGMVTAGFIRRSADPANRRSQFVELTAKGRRTILAAAPDHFRRLANAVNALSPGEQTTLRKALALMTRFGEELAP